jgi:threonine dehydrogenase-like Zn-dependent dehydrogenase
VWAVASQNAELTLVERPVPRPARGQVRIGVLRCGICGSDLHARTGSDAWADLAARMGYNRLARSEQSVVYGHEFCGQVLEHGPGCRGTVPNGALVVALPLLRSGAGVDMIGLSMFAPGGYAEQMLVQEALMLPVPNGLPAEVAALTEPLAVAWHAVRRAEVGRRTVAIVIGCGPIGLGVILMLKAKGVRTVVASDFSLARRELAARCGADVVVDPGVQEPFSASPRRHLQDAPAALDLAVGTLEKLGRLPVGWWHVLRLAEAVGARPRRPIVFECVGVPGVIESIIEGAPLFSRVVVAGVCVGPDRFTPALAVNKELDLRFAFGYSPLEFRDTLHLLAEGKVEPEPMLTGIVGLPGVASAFAALGTPERHAKILIDPAHDAAEPVPVPA